MIKTKKQEITVQTMHGPRLVMAQVYKGLALHASFDQLKHFIVTHAVSGLKVTVADYDKKDRGLRLMEMLTDIGIDWESADIASIKKHGKKVLRIINEERDLHSLDIFNSVGRIP